MSDERLLKELRFRCENTFDEWPCAAGERIEELLRRVTALEAALGKVKTWVDDEGWCPICDEHTCRAGNCILADLSRRGGGVA